MRSRNAKAAQLILLWTISLAAGCSAPLIDLSDLDIQTYPSQDNQVIASGESIRVTFSAQPVATSAESLFHLSNAEGTVSGDFSWNGKTMTFAPVPALIPGKRYALQLSGQVSMGDGRTFSVRKNLPFFSGSGAAPGKLVSSSPASGASSSVTTPLVLTFDSAIDPVSFQSGFTVSPAVAVTKTWSADSLTVTITPLSQWTNLTLHSWQLSGVKAASGLPLAQNYSGSFLTNADQVPPTIVSVLPATAAGIPLSWSPTGATLDALVNGNGILVTTSEEVALPTLESAFHLTPSIKGHFVKQSAFEAVYVLDENLALGTVYTLQISTDLQDVAGNAMTTAWLGSFTPNLPYIHVTKVDLIDLSPGGLTSSSYTAFNTPNLFPVCAPLAPLQSLQIRFTFDTDFAGADRVQFATLAFCQPLFPTTGTVALNSPTLATVAFESPRKVVLTYQGLSVNATPNAPYYYQIKIPGGPAGVSNSAGQSLKEDVWINFRTGS